MKILTDFDYIFENGDKLFFTSDTHFGHERIIQYCNRPFKDAAEMNEALIRNWNAVVPPDGTVFHLGDFAMGMDQDRTVGILSRLNGTIYLVAGNHDRHSLPPAVQDMFKDKSDILPTPEIIIEEVCKFYSLDSETLRGQGRSKDTSLARQIAMYLIRRMTNLSLKEIGKEFDGRDHTTVLHSIERIEDLSKNDPEKSEVIKDITANINIRYE